MSEKVGEIDLNDEVFGVQEINQDLFYEVVKAQLASRRSGTSAARFLGELLRLAPAEIVAELGDGFDDLKPRWALGTAKMLARALSQHVAELNRRGDAIGERFAAQAAEGRP